MEAEEKVIEATSTSHSPLFRVPDEIVIRIRKHAFDDGYVGARVDIRSRGHLPDHAGANAARVRGFIDYEHW